MAVICPAILAADPHVYREQMEKVAPFAKRVQIDLTDGVFAKHKTVGIHHVWWPAGVTADIHLMYQKPMNYLEHVIKLKPHMVIVHAEAEGDFYKLAVQLHKHRIKIGVALLPETPVSVIKPALPYINHMLIFSGDLGKFGGRAHLSLVGKVSEVKALKSGIEVGWDGGVNPDNAHTLAHQGIDVLNAGGFIQNATDPQRAYATLESSIK
jgi:ribulose-phosphate 3-epimerase